MKTSGYYYQVLGIPENSGMKEIKEAFRRKAKAFHPDINKSAGAHEHFLDINEAYNYLSDLHSRGFVNPADQLATEEYYYQWAANQRQHARARAAYRARMKFEEFKNSSVYKTTSILSYLLDYFLMFIGVFIIIAGALNLYIQGLFITENGREVLNSRGLIVEFVITVAGVLFIMLAWSSIKQYRQNARKK